MSLEDEDYCYLTTRGRVSGEPREIEIWFALKGDTVYLLSGGGARANWVRNILAAPAVRLRIANETFEGRARVIGDPDEVAEARELVAGKYGRLDSEWRREGLPVAVDLER